MITLIAGTNRTDSYTLRVAEYYFDRLRALGAEVNLFSLKDFDVHYRSEALIKVEAEWLVPSDKFVVIIPEYNGSFPGILKTMMDNTDIRKAWWGKKALLVGLASGRGGNARGLDDMTNILHYLKVNVHYNKIPLSRIHEEFDNNGKFISENSKNIIELQLQDFLTF